ncbi:hypothetical protein DFH08DRAFT_961659 [Mycena albidolilacea]|uniref:Uncharacterized protein n=1 Tax=Mycena albidolilacea TaxID=1033008 RepID=A0AAD7EPV8_9AGAR|nr:hypothetical protein DFH08DRAFT_961659 [Mycena albidolilacea]
MSPRLLMIISPGLLVLGIFLSEVILMLRTWALWDRRRMVLIWLIILGTCTLVASIVTTQLELESLDYITTTGVGCTLAKASSIIIFSYLSVTILETMVLTAVRAYRDLRYSRLPWLIQLYRDGILFFIYLLMISLANILVPILAPSMFSNWLASPQRVLHSVLCSRVLLHIRAPPSHHMSFPADRHENWTTRDPRNNEAKQMPLIVGSVMIPYLMRLTGRSTSEVERQAALTRLLSTMIDEVKTPITVYLAGRGILGLMRELCWAGEWDDFGVSCCQTHIDTVVLEDEGHFSLFSSKEFSDALEKSWKL